MTWRAEALRQVLRLRVGECHRHAYAVVWGKLTGGGSLQRDLNKCPLIIALSVGNNPTAQMISLVYKLRTQLGWIGAFIAVVGSVEELEQLNVASLTGTRNGRHQFGLRRGSRRLEPPPALVRAVLYD